MKTADTETAVPLEARQRAARLQDTIAELGVRTDLTVSGVVSARSPLTCEVDMGLLEALIERAG